jgi:hypothetical protein
MGNITVQWFNNTVGSIALYASGYGPTGPSGPAGYGAYPYVTNAGVSPFSIASTTHLQGTNVAVYCFSGALVNGSITGYQVYCSYQMASSGNGDMTVTYGGSTVASVMVIASGRAQPFVVNSTSSPQTILATAHKQGFTPDVTCWDGSIGGGATQGNKVYCASSKNINGDVTITWGGNTVGSIQIQ